MRSDTGQHRRRPILVAAGAAALVGLIGGAATDVGPWYQALEKPALNPPDWAFPLGWTAIYALCVISAVTAWRDSMSTSQRNWLISLFFVNAVLNIAWSFLFFTLRRPDWALAEVATLWLSVAALIGLFWTFSRPAALLLLPYIAWVSFAAYLNLAVVQLNAPF
ncbi:MAG: TspO/MBR family protein [Pseudomonadota bacterium]